MSLLKDLYDCAISHLLIILLVDYILGKNVTKLDQFSLIIGEYKVTLILWLHLDLIYISCLKIRVLNILEMWRRYFLIHLIRFISSGNILIQVRQRREIGVSSLKLCLYRILVLYRRFLLL
jgi:hypothetical protein